MNNFIMHYGIKGQQWGIRRFQNEDGTLTEEGLRRYGTIRGESFHPNHPGVKDEYRRTDLPRIKDEYRRTELPHVNSKIEKQRRVEELEPGKNLQEVSDQGLQKRKEKIDQIQKNLRVQTLLQGAMGVSLIAAGKYMNRTYPGSMGRFLQRFGMGYLLGTGVGHVIGTTTNHVAKNVINQEEARRRSNTNK